MINKLDYYQILGIKRAATQAEIKEAYRFKALAHHPDRFTAQFKEQAEEELKSINAAYEILGNPRKKAIYDTELDQEEHPNKNEQFNELKRQKERVKKETEERQFKEKKRKEEIRLIIAIAGMLVLGWFGWSWWSHDTSAPSEITNPVTAEDWYNRGIDLKMGHWNEEGPLQAWNMAIQIDPQSETAVKAWHEKGLYFANLAKYDESIQAYDKAIQLIQLIPHGNHWEAIIFEDKGIALYRQGKVDESIQAFDRAIELDNFAEFWHFKGDVLKAAGRTSEADAAYAKAKDMGYL